jgi:hypothetical protein
MKTILAPGMWIVPVEPLPSLAKSVSVQVDDKPHFCTELDLLSNLPRPFRNLECAVCGNSELYLKVREFPHHCFCPTHWRPVLSPKAEFLSELLAPTHTVKDKVNASSPREVAEHSFPERRRVHAHHRHLG